MASRSFYDLSTCCLSLAHPSPFETSPSRQISKYLKVVPVDGKGLGVVATQDIKPFTLLLAECPDIADLDDRDRPKEIASVAAAYRRMSPIVRTRFNELHEAKSKSETRELRIWRTNALYWNPNKDLKAESMAAFLNMSPHQPLFDKKRMHLTSTKSIHIGEEVTICYNDTLYYMTRVERTAFLRYTYDFTCPCRACTDREFGHISDQRRQTIKQIFYCDIFGWLVAFDFSTKIANYEDAIRMVVDSSLLKNKQHNLNNSRGLQKPGVLRRACKLEYDEGLINVGLIKFIMNSSMAFLIDLQIRGSSGEECSDGNGFQRTIQLLTACESLLRQLYPPGHPDQEEGARAKADILRLFSAEIKYDAMTIDDCQELISTAMDAEPDPLSERAAYGS
ncbi:uncharacterized protein LY89DRAFT_677479 [Mollisia scopiformis]|uniref:SET domain-containing protein n=1 Tax=Mollisia scopiformis TaxID=149040 RepID=A0A132B610_MOLSC|nr:uncharacterized protein LY89DRAFT_677479 [Mollisia scopiformis]KUJ07693.1 hypothetical protein LY89DRAFT_677479 [Mollisia scopiformis]